MLVSFEHHRPHSLWGWLIALATRSIWSHTATIIHTPNGVFRYEALTSKGYVKRPWSYRIGVYETVLDLPEKYAVPFLASHEKMVGTKYPKTWYLALSYLLAPFVRDMKRRLYCSQAELKSINDAGLYDSKWDKRFNSKPSPGVLYFIAQTLAARPDLRTLGT